ncbi:MAG: hypothetical protein GY950_25835, partial [bacterium]|nr:hypothetical protein [bacterium]
IAAVGARLLLYNLAVLTAVFLSLLWLLAGNINLFQPPLLYIIAAVVVVNGFFFSIGCAAGMLGSRSAAAITIAVFYFLSLLGIPWLAGKAARANANNLQSLFQFELENTRIMMAVEKRLIEKFGVFKSGDIAPPEIIKAVREVVNNEFEELRRRETGMKNDILGKIHAQHTLSAFYPVLFYMSLAREITGQGGLSLIDFYTYGQEIKKQFITFYVTMKFLSRNKPGEVESFIKANENLFKAHSLVPRGFWLGAAVTLLYTVALLGLAYFLFNRRLHPLPGRDSIDTWAISLSKGEDAAVVTTFPRTAATFYNVLSGKHNRFGGKLAVAGKPVRAGEKQAFTYLCAPGEIPGEIPVNSLLRIFKLALNVTPEEAVGLSDGLSAEACKKRYDKLEPWEKVKVLINAARLSRGAVFLFHNLEDALPADFVDSYEKEVQALKGAGKLVIHIVTRGSVLRGVSRTFAVYKKGNSYGIRKLGPA